MQNVEAASKALAEGRPFVPHEAQAGDPGLFQNRAGFHSYLMTWLEAASDGIAKLSDAKALKARTFYSEIAVQALTALGDDRGAELAGQGARTALYRLSVRNGETRSNGERTGLHPADARLLILTLRARAEASGLDPDKVGARMKRGALNAEEECRWVLEDVRAVASRQGRELSDPGARTKVAMQVDRFYEEAAGIIARSYGREVRPEATALRRTLMQMVTIEELHGRVAFDIPDSAGAFRTDMDKRYGPSIIADLAAGRTEGLAADFPDQAERTKIAKAVIAAAVEHEEIGLPLKEARQALARLRGRSQSEKARDTDRER